MCECVNDIDKESHPILYVCTLSDCFRFPLIYLHIYITKSKLVGKFPRVGQKVDQECSNNAHKLQVFELVIGDCEKYRGEKRNGPLNFTRWSFPFLILST